MLYVFYGDDDFSIHEALEGLKALVGSLDVLDANVTRAHVSALSPPQLQAMCSTVPFLASRRIVIVEGLLALFEGRRTPRRGRSAQDQTSSWLSIVDHVPDMPSSTDLVLLDGEIRRDNALLSRLSPLGQVREFKSLTGAGLNRWIQQRAAETDGTISREGVTLLAELVGGNLWAMSSEIEKLSLYCQGRTMEAADVRLLVSFSRETNIFNAVDAIMEGRYSDALRTIRHLNEVGATGPYVVTMVARQVRLLLLAKDMARMGVPSEQMGARLGVPSPWVLNKLREQGRRYSATALESLHRGLLETDRAIKRSHITEDAVGEYLVEVFTEASPGARRR